MIFPGQEVQEKGRCRGAVNEQSPMALDLGDETVKGELVDVKVKNDLDASARVFVLNL